jgi:choline dehydrogenase
MKMETSALGPSPYRGGDGPLKVTIHTADNPLFQASIEAGKQAGLGTTDDVNGFKQEGVSRFERSTFNGVRSSVARRYLHPARGARQHRSLGRVRRSPLAGAHRPNQ